MPSPDRSTTDFFLPIAKGIFLTHQAMTRSLNALAREHDLTIPKLVVLAALYGSDEESLLMSQVADLSLMTQGTLTGVIDRLEEKKLVARKTHPDSRRSTLIRITAKGRKVCDRVLPEFDELQRTAFSDFSEEEQLTIARQLQTLYISFSKTSISKRWRLE